MDIKKLDRTALKSYFVKNAVPTAGNFVDLIDGSVNQKEDGIAKIAGEPLSVQAEGAADTDLKKVLNFYKTFADAKPAWTLALNPRVNPKDAATAKPGFSVGDADGNSKLFIDQTTGNVGVGTVEPGGYKLNVTGTVLFTGNYLYANAESAGRLRVGAAWGMPGLYSGDDGAKPLTLGVASGQKVYLGTNTGDAFVEGGTGNAYFKGNVGIGVTAPANKLQLGGNVHMDGHSIFFRQGATDQQDVIRWNNSTDRLDIGGWNGVTLGHTLNTPNSVTPVVTIDRNGIVQQPWQTPVLQNGWKNYGNTYNDPGYFKDSMGIVHLRGMVRGGPINTAIFTLPAGYRPAARELQAICTNSNTIGRLDILATGEVWPVSGNSDWYSLDGVTFRAA